MPAYEAIFLIHVYCFRVVSLSSKVCVHAHQILHIHIYSVATRSGEPHNALHSSIIILRASAPARPCRASPVIKVLIIGASLSEPHIDRTSGRFSIYYGIYMVRPSSARRVRPHADQEVDRKSPTSLASPRLREKRKAWYSAYT